MGLKGNDWANVEAGRAREVDQKSIGINFESIKVYIRRIVKYEPRLEGRLKEVYGSKIDGVNGEIMVSVTMTQMRSGHCAKSKYYKKIIGVSEEAECVDCGEEEEKDHRLECPAKERSRIICGIAEV